MFISTPFRFVFPTPGMQHCGNPGVWSHRFSHLEAEGQKKLLCRRLRVRVTCAALSDGVAGALWSSEWGCGGRAWEQGGSASCGAWEVTCKWTCVVWEALTPSTSTPTPSTHGLNHPSLPCLPADIQTRRRNRDTDSFHVTCIHIGIY